jgi:acetyltransferase-like isoleucine patch superfamily enzyme
MKPRQSHGTGLFSLDQLARVGEGTVLEDGVRIWHPETVAIGASVYVGHGTLLKGYYSSRMVIGDGTWIGQLCFFHSAGGITIGANVGIGPRVTILTSTHRLDQLDRPILHAELTFTPVTIEDDADIGVGAVLMPGVTVGRGAQVAAGAVVVEPVAPYAIVVGVPARVLRSRRGSP